MKNAIELRRHDELEAQRLLPMHAGLPPEGAPDDRLDLRALFVTLRRRRRLFFTILGTILGLAILVTALQTPRYTAVAQVVLNTRDDQVAPTKDTKENLPTSDIADTEAEVMRSRELATSVADALHLADDPSYNPLLSRHVGRVRGLLQTLGIVAPRKPIAVTPELSRRVVVAMLMSELDVQRVGLTYVFNISITTPIASAAQAIANEYARQYTQLYLTQKRAGDNQATTFLAQSLEKLRIQAQADTARVQEYRIANNIPSTTGTPLTEQEISSYNQEVATARAQAAEDRARLDTAREQLRHGSQGDDVGEALGSGVVSGLRARQAEISGRLANLQSQYGPRYAEVQQAQGELNDVNQQIKAEINRVVSNLEAKVQVSDGRLASIEGSLSAAQGKLSASNRASVGLDDLQRRAEASQQTYDSYLARYKETMAQEGTERPESRISSLAELPLSPTSPRPLLNIALALIVGSGLGVGAALISEMLFSGLTTAADIESRLGIRCLGSIPLAKSVSPRATQPINAVVEEPHSGFAEAFRSLRASIHYAALGVQQVLMITSALPREGKTTISTCLARMSALNGERVVLMDVDVRQRGVSRLVRGNAGGPGLLQVLRGEATLDDALVLDEETGAYMLPIQANPGDIGDLLIGEEMDSLIEELRARFTLVILDAPPVLPIADTRSLAAKVDAVVMIARWRSTADHAVRTALRMLPHRLVPILGIALSQVDIRKQAKFGYGDGAFYYEKYKHYYA